MHRSLALIGLALGAYAASISAQTWTPEQQELWRLEEQQWKMGAAKDAAWIQQMVHDDASVWGSEWPGPQNKESLARWSKYEYGSSTVLEQELFPISMTITGNVAVVHYRYRVASEDLEKKRKIVTGRYTDVFVKDGGRWMFITWAGGDDPKDE